MNERETKNTGIKSWAEEDRPREKLVAKGRQALTDSELLAILIGSGTRGLTAVELAKQILKASDNNLNALGRNTIADFQKFPGIGEAKAISIIAALELGRRRQLTQVKVRPKISSSKDAYDIIAPILIDLRHEEFWVLLLNNANEVVKYDRISIGGTRATVVDPKIVLKIAIDVLAAGIIVLHNHPSGSLKASDADISLTKKLAFACKAIDIRLLDHLIVSEQGYYSFADAGELNLG